MLPPSGVRDAVERALAASGSAARITNVRRVGGGCISPAARVDFDARAPAFLKWSSASTARPDFFRREALSLSQLAATGVIALPRVEAVGHDWLLLEWIEPGPAAAHSWRQLGIDLAKLHNGTTPSGECSGPSGMFGWPVDNYIGALTQVNGWAGDWPAFWRDRRLAPQFSRAAESGFFTASDNRRFEQLLASLDALVGAAADADGPTLVHGDLWSGNVHVSAAGQPFVIDPATYVAHREVDLAMAELFGGFGTDFFDAYRAHLPTQPGYAPGRRAVYQLYYILVHVNLFGAGYVDSARNALTTALGAI